MNKISRREKIGRISASRGEKLIKLPENFDKSRELDCLREITRRLVVDVRAMRETFDREKTELASLGDRCAKLFEIGAKIQANNEDLKSLFEEKLKKLDQTESRSKEIEKLLPEIDSNFRGME